MKRTSKFFLTTYLGESVLFNGLLTQTSILSTTYQVQLNGRMVFSVGLFGPILISFNDNAVVRNLLFEVFQRFANT